MSTSPSLSAGILGWFALSAGLVRTVTVSVSVHIHYILNTKTTYSFVFFLLVNSFHVQLFISF